MKALDLVNRWAWWLLVAALPFTSFPKVADLVGSSTVAGLSIPFLFILMAAFLIPYFLRRGGLFPQILPLLGFFLLAVISILVSFFILIPSYKGILPWRENVQSLATLVIGLGFYLVTALWLDDEKKITWTLRIINWTGLAILIWSAVQAFVWIVLPLKDFPPFLRSIQGTFSLGRLYWGRVTGFALEPSWLAHQFNMLYLPIWLAATVRGFSAQRWRIWKFSFENFLLAGGAVIFFLTFSRIGLLGFLVMLFYVFLLLNARFTRWVSGRIEQKQGGKSDQARRKRLNILLWVGLIVVYLVIIAGVLYGFSRFDKRMADLFTFDSTVGNPLLRYADKLKFGERLVYWDAGWNIFNDHPFLGVGLGNAGFFMPQKLNGYGFFMVEVRDLLYRSGDLLNLKSFWVRLLAETGWLGFSFFITWYWFQWKTGRYLSRNRSALLATLGLAGCFSMIGFLAEGFSVDSYALPYLWVAAGLMTAGYQLNKRQIKTLEVNNERE